MADSRDDFIIAIRYALLKKGTKQKFSLFFLISLSILIITLDKLSLPIVSSTRAVINDLVYEVAFIAATPGKFLSYLNKKQKDHFNTVNKNKILIEEIESLKSDRYDNLYLKTENYSLRKVLDLSNEGYKKDEISIKARVIIDRDSPYLKSLLVSKGRKQNIIKGMSVFSKGYLIGTIIESNYITARVLLITDLNSKIPVVIEGTNTNAILGGTGKKTDLRLDYLPDGFILEPNKILYTSGKDGFLAIGLPVAETYLDKKNNLRIKSLADPRQASIINISKGQFNK
jgi:rod shape-determining protein MreC